jgi:uncharacterized phage-associated protein
MNIHDATDYLIQQVRESGESLSNLKLQKLMYYVQAWFLAFEGKKFFEGDFQAWVHGPVSREIYNRFSATKSLYAEITEDDIRQEFSPDNLTDDERKHIDNVLSVYAKLSGPQLEEMTHRESPWLDARGSLKSWERCENTISTSNMERFYKARLQE